MPILVEKNLGAKMRDGTVLRADVYRPAGDGRHPVLVQRTPYNKEYWPISAATLDPIRAAEAGYAVVIQDVRSRWASDGDVFHSWVSDHDDGFDTLEWASALPFGDGATGVYGLSYTGRTAWAAASSAPASLRAISAVTSPNDIFRHMYRGGALNWGLLVYWSLAIGPGALARTAGHSPGFFPELVKLVDDIDDYESWVRHLPLSTFPPARPGDERFLPFFFDTVEHVTEDEHWRSGPYQIDHSSVNAPALILAGWHDLLLGDDLDHFRSMRDRGGSDEARNATRIVIGPWSHGTFLNTVGELDFGFRASGMFLDLREDLTKLQLRWFDRWLKGVRNGADEEPPVRIFVQGINRWRDEDSWPLARAVEETWFLAADGRLGRGAPPSGAPASAYDYDPADPCPTRGGPTLLPRTYPAGPVNQRDLLERRDVLAFTSDPLSADLEVTGRVRAVLYAATSAPDTDWVVKLCDVHPGGRTFNVCDGILRASYRRSVQSRELVEPGACERYEIDLWATSIVFRAGHRIRVLVTSSDFPRYDRNLNTSELGAFSSEMAVARQTIFHDADHASHIILPVV